MDRDQAQAILAALDPAGFEFDPEDAAEPEPEVGLDLAAFVARYGLTMQLIPDRTDGPYRHRPDEGAPNFRVELAAVDPETRLTRTGSGWYFTSESEPAPEAAPDPASETFAAVLAYLRQECRWLEESEDAFDLAIAGPWGAYQNAVDARNDLRLALDRVEQMRRLFGESGYQEFLNVRMRPQQTAPEPAAPPPPVTLPPALALALLQRQTLGSLEDLFHNLERDLDPLAVVAEAVDRDDLWGVHNRLVDRVAWGSLVVRRLQRQVPGAAPEGAALVSLAAELLVKVATRRPPEPDRPPSSPSS